MNKCRKPVKKQKIFDDFQGVSENKEIDEFFAVSVEMQDKKRRNPWWIPSIFNAADAAHCKKDQNFDFSDSPYDKSYFIGDNCMNLTNICCTD